MKRLAVVMFWVTLSTASASAQQVCQSNIPQSTPTADFSAHGDGTLTHNLTGLMWKQCLQGLSGVDCAIGTASIHSWQQALQLADGHSFAGYSDWRLPNIKELASIVEQSCHGPAINLSAFPNSDPVENRSVWSGSPNANDSNNAWSVSFYLGEDNGFDNRKLNLLVWLVRGRQ